MIFISKVIYCSRNKTQMSDGDPENKTIKRKRKSIGILQRLIVDVSNVFSTIRLRCPIQIDNGYERLVLDSGRSFLFYFRLLLVIVYIAYETIK